MKKVSGYISVRAEEIIQKLIDTDGEVFLEE